MTLGFILFSTIHAKWPKPAIKTLHNTQWWQANTFLLQILISFQTHTLLFCMIIRKEFLSQIYQIFVKLGFNLSNGVTDTLE
jgi:hypothetical protein